MIYYAFEPNRPQRQKKTVQVMYPDAIIVEKFPFDDWFLCTLSEDDTLIINDIYDLCDYGSNFNIQRYILLYNKNVNILFERSPGCDTSQIRKIAAHCSIAIDFILNIEIEAFKRRNEFDILHKRASMTSAKLSGKRIGGKTGVKLVTKKSVEVKHRILELSKDFNGSLSDIEVMKFTNISRNTY